jgi:hypothetical protein
MKKMYLTVAIVLTIASSLMFSSCIGSFALTNKVLAWNKQVGNKFVNELVFFAFWCLPVYELTALADVLVLNSIEFWSGSNPATASNSKVIQGKDAPYLVKSDKNGYTITNLKNKQVVKFDFNAANNSWAVEANGQKHEFMQFVDDSHVKMVTPDGSFETVELSQQGVFAYQQVAMSSCFAKR